MPLPKRRLVPRNTTLLERVCAARLLGTSSSKPWRVCQALASLSPPTIALTLQSWQRSGTEFILLREDPQKSKYHHRSAAGQEWNFEETHEDLFFRGADELFGGHAWWNLSRLFQLLKFALPRRNLREKKNANVRNGNPIRGQNKG